MNIPKLSETIEAVKSLLSKPYTTKFPKEKHEPSPIYRGKPEYDEDKCVGCGACFEVCPGRAIKLEDYKDKKGKWKRKLTINYDSCMFCGQCERNCITEEGIKLSRDFDTATTEKRESLINTVEKDLMACELCGKPVATKDHLLWVSRKIGRKVFSNSSLLYIYLNSLNLSKKAPPVSHKHTLRQDRIRLLCAECRRKAVLKS